MLRNHLTIAFRTLTRQKVTSFINITGLAVGTAVCFLILLWVRDEVRYDRFHEKSERIYRVLWDARFGDNEWTIPLGPAPVAGALQASFPEVEAAGRLIRSGRTLRIGETNVVEKDFFFADRAIFDIFTIPLVSGDSRTAFDAPDAVVLTEETARRYFGDESPLGRAIPASDGTELRVTGVVRSLPRQSHWRFDFLAPIEHQEFTRAQWWEGWGNARVYTYVALREGESAGTLSAKFERYVAERVMGNADTPSGNYSRFLFQPLTDIHLRSHMQYELQPGGNESYVYLFSLIGAFILILACINYINLATARAVRRGREVGIRKALGSARTRIVTQFALESLVVVVPAMLLGLLLVELALPALNELTGKELATNDLGLLPTLGALGAMIVLVGLLAGGYPALVLSRFQPAAALRGQLETSAGGQWLRNGLVVSQFCISIALIVGTMVVRTQLDYIQSKQLGFDREHVLVVQSAGTLGTSSAAFVDEIEALPQVVKAAGASSLPGYTFDSTVFAPEQPANYEHTSLSYVWADPGLVEVLDLRMARGRSLSALFGTDSSSFMLNEAAARALGWEEPLGKELVMGNWIRGPVVGVVNDFHHESLRNEVRPLVFMFNRWPAQLLAVRLHPGTTREAVAAVREVWDRFVDTRPFAYSFLDADLHALYENEERMARIFSIFAGLAVFIACLGLFGLAAYTAERRTKEIGIRKVLGASVAGIVLLLSKDSARLVLVAMALATPIGYVAMNMWLEGFAYRADITWWMFAAAGLAALLIALLTVSYHATRVASADPVESLRYE